MKEFVIVTDTTTDLPREYVEKHHLYMMSLPYTFRRHILHLGKSNAGQRVL